jgi:hypothetical protein
MNKAPVVPEYPSLTIEQHKYGVHDLFLHAIQALSVCLG